MRRSRLQSLLVWKQFVLSLFHSLLLVCFKQAVWNRHTRRGPLKVQRPDFFWWSHQSTALMFNWVHLVHRINLVAMFSCTTVAHLTLKHCLNVESLDWINWTLNTFSLIQCPRYLPATDKGRSVWAVTLHSTAHVEARRGWKSQQQDVSS